MVMQCAIIDVFMSNKWIGIGMLNIKLRTSMHMVCLLMLVGCASSSSTKIILNSDTKFIFTEPRSAPILTMQTSAWASFISAHKLGIEEGKLNYTTESAYPGITKKFSHAFIKSLQKNRFNVETSSSGTIGSDVQGVSGNVVISSYLNAGFVYKTFGSDTYEPYVEAVVAMRYSDGTLIFKKLVVVTNRSFNPLMKSISSVKQYDFKDIQEISGGSEVAVDALEGLAAELGNYYVEELINKGFKLTSNNN